MPKKLFDNLDDFGHINSKTIIVTDIDGTISNISSKPDEAFVSPSMKKVLIEVERIFHVLAIVTGRSIDDATKMISVPGALYIGNHGMEYMKNGQVKIDKSARSYLPRFFDLNEKLRKSEALNIPGVLIEYKKTSIAIHYRLTRDPQSARKTILKTISNTLDSDDLQIKEGKMIVEIRPCAGNDKGKIIDEIVERYYAKQLIYLGDDVTDRDAFCEINKLDQRMKINGKSIVVKSNDIPYSVWNAADYYVESVDDVENFFRWLVKNC